MEINERFLTLLTPEGEFLKAQKLDKQYQIGQEIDFFPLRDEEIKKKSLPSIFSSFKAKTAFAAVMALLLVCTSIFTINGNNEVYAYMSIDINPSIELGVNDQFQVIEILPYNKDGEKIVKAMHDWKRKDIHVITKQIIQEVKTQGFAKMNHEIVIATVKTKTKETLQTASKWENEITEIKEDIQKEQLEVKIMEASKKDRKQAKELGLSVGTYKESQGKKDSSKASEPKRSENNHMVHESNKEETSKNFENAPISEENQNQSKVPPGQNKKDQVINNQDQSQGKQFQENIPPGQSKKQDFENKGNKNGNSEKKNNDKSSINDRNHNQDHNQYRQNSGNRNHDKKDNSNWNSKGNKKEHPYQNKSKEQNRFNNERKLKENNQ